MTYVADGIRWIAMMTAVGGIAYLVLYQFAMFTQVVIGALEALSQRRKKSDRVCRMAKRSGELPGISIIIPAYNEEVSILRTVESARKLEYPELQILVVNDGSRDQTLNLLFEDLDLEPCPDQGRHEIPTEHVRGVFVSRHDRRVRVVDKRNGGKADALNVGINLSETPFVCAIDADVILDREALAHLVLPFLDDEEMVASSGFIRLTNGCRFDKGLLLDVDLPESFLEKCQILEFTRAFTLGRLSFNRLGGHLIISGAFGLFRRKILVEFGGYQPLAIGEDMELVVRLQKNLRDQGRRCPITFVPDALAFTEGPLTVSDLGQQRTRWHQGLLTTLRLHRELLFNRKYGAVGMLAFPYFLILELLAPVIELLGWLTIPLFLTVDLVPLNVALVFFLVAIGLASAVSVSAVLIDGLIFGFPPRLRQKLVMLMYCFLEHVGYHQMSLFFRLRAFPRYYGKIHLKGGWVSPARENASAPGGAG